MATFVFLHVGNDTDLATILVQSIRAQNSNARIIQCTDSETPSVNGADDVIRIDGDTGHLMVFRLQCFSQLGLEETALYLDTDMICVAEISPETFLDGCDAAVCERDFEKDALFRADHPHPDLTRQGWTFSEHEGKTLNETFPYVACATITRNHRFWDDCLETLLGLEEKYHVWYGDQEAIRRVVDGGIIKIGTIPENRFGHLPGSPDPDGGSPLLLHFKGAERKQMMIELGRENGFL
ncbi:MAG: hypothetical protein HN377_01705 [Alphaproteobacteria bacterium]|jgi:hypothetical protein|nr:hypothetical protein [Alphaproteobacteria bacterium]MBT7942950.1 hypothetical protein [Alphaproteobacteria bacterium]